MVSVLTDFHRFSPRRNDSDLPKSQPSLTLPLSPASPLSLLNEDVPKKILSDSIRTYPRAMVQNCPLNHLAVSTKPAAIVNGGFHPSSRRILELSTSSEPRSRSTASDFPVSLPARRMRAGGKGRSRVGRSRAVASCRISWGVETSSPSLTRYVCPAAWREADQQCNSVMKETNGRFMSTLASILPAGR